MSEDTTTDVVEETTEETPATVQETPVEETEDLGALKRAYERQKEESRQAKEDLRRIREDETARAELLKEWGYEVADDEDTSDEEDFEFEDDDPLEPVTAKLGELEQWKADQEAKDMAAQIREDLTGIHGESEWDLDDKSRRWIVYEASQDPKGFNRDALERAHKSLIDQWEAIATQGVERAKKPRPKTSHVPRGGKAATETPGWNDMSWEQQAEEMARRVQSNAQ